MGNCVITVYWKTCLYDHNIQKYVKSKAISAGFSIDTDPNYLSQTYLLHGYGYSYVGADISGSWLLIYDKNDVIERMKTFGESMKRDLKILGATDVDYHTEYLPS